MSSDEEVLAGLKALADADRGREAPPEVEQRLRFAFHRKHRRRVWPWVAAVAAAIALAMVVAYPKRNEAAPAAHAVNQPAPAISNEIVRSVEPRQALRAVPRQRTEVVTPFFPLMDVPPPLERAELVRVNVPAAAMRSVGLPVREDRLAEPVEAEVLVSEEGLATAIRFVKFQ